MESNLHTYVKGLIDGRSLRIHDRVISVKKWFFEEGVGDYVVDCLAISDDNQRYAIEIINTNYPTEKKINDLKEYGYNVLLANVSGFHTPNTEIISEETREILNSRYRSGLLFYEC